MFNPPPLRRRSRTLQTQIIRRQRRKRRPSTRLTSLRYNRRIIENNLQTSSVITDTPVNTFGTTGTEEELCVFWEVKLVKLYRRG